MKNDAMAIFLTSKKDLSPSFFSRLDFNKGEEKDKKSTRRSMLCLLCLNKIKLKRVSGPLLIFKNVMGKTFFHTLTLWLKIIKKVQFKDDIVRENSNAINFDLKVYSW